MQELWHQIVDGFPGRSSTCSFYVVLAIIAERFVYIHEVPQ